ncbi:type I polyketide synthase [Nocardia terpenica]|uniref:Polyketide synthase n=1 Tax=Nocardia terpenica TaxID=455432 RepID=A0A291RFV7_9NOCA|nr:type I polyketide synthase [Nocardia terpenica]ATL66178.1 polyketide synthase [Nocardia terpenica]
MDTESRLRDYLKRVTTDLRAARRELETERGRRTEPLAVVGMACRFPGGIATPEAFWEALRGGRDMVGPFPTDRGWDLEHLFDADPDHLGTSYTSQGAFLDEAGQFDAGFFEISPREALAMDPQQRLLLETSWEALESAGIDPRGLGGQQIGVFVGVSNQGYGTPGPAEVEGHVLTGTSGAVVSGRLAYVFGLEGPTVTVDTMCSSSLVALHLAAQAVRAGECEAALVGGATIMGTARNFVEFSRQRGLATDGRCKPFSADADGTGWGEAVGTVFLERLSTARREGHPVLAVLRGTAINSDGASNGLTAPNGPSQQRVIGAALRRSGLRPDEIDVVEAHGTGTELGDPIEAQALLATYGQDRDRPLLLGALKGATGHTQAASGVAALIKMVLALRHGYLPGILHLNALSPHVDWSAGAVEPLVGGREWEAVEDRPRRAGISSFGGSGTNAHVVLEEPPAAEEAETDSAATISGPVAWPLSARDAEALSAMAANLAAVVGDSDARQVAAALCARSTFDHRAVLIDPGTEAVARLGELAEGRTGDGVVRGRVRAGGDAPVFVFPGQGAQWAGMGSELLDGTGRSAEVFARRLAECSAAVEAAGGPDVVAVLRDGGERSLDDVGVVQPVSWAVMVALAAVWEDAGVAPGAVIGHSQGEIAAAVVAGALSVTDGARVVTARALALRAVAGSGAMASLGETPEQAAERIRELDGVEIAAINGPAAVVVAGPVEGVQAAIAAAEAEGRRAKLIPVDYASHTPGMEVLREPVLTALDGLTPAAPRVPWLSTHDVDWIDSDSADAAYWFANLRDTVRFAAGVTALLDAGYDSFLEISAHPVLVPAIEDVADATGVEIAAGGTLRRGEGGASRVLTALAEAWVGGVDIEWDRFVAGVDPRAVSLPTYPFQRRPYWLAPTAAAAGADPADAAFWNAVADNDIAALVEALPGDAIDSGREAAAVLADAVPLLARWRRGRADKNTRDGWRYRIVWQPHPDTTATATGTWMLVRPSTFAADDAVVTRVRDALAAAGIEVVDVAVEPTADRADIAALLGEFAAEPDGVVSLLAAAESDHPEYRGLPVGVVTTLGLLQGLGDKGIAAPLWAVTVGAETTAADDHLTRPLQAAVWGLGRVAALEHPDRWGGLVDLPEADPASDDPVRLLPAVLAHPVEDQVALRAAGALVRRLQRATRPAREAANGRRTRGTALITGGTGGLGAHTARMLARSGTAHLVLLSRRGPEAEGAAELRAELEAMGPRVTIAACDADDPAAVAAVVERIEAEGETIRTVVHTAGVGILLPLAETGLEQFAAGAGGKLSGARVLDALFDGERGRELDAFVLFSSVAGLWGAGDHGAYSAANAVADAIASARRARGLVGTSIPWGIWEASGGGMGRDVISTQLKWLGIRFMPATLAIDAMADALEDDETLLAIADIDWDTFAPVFTAARRRPLLDGVPDVAAALGRTAAADADTEGPGSGLRARMAAATDPRRVVLDTVRDAVAAALGFAARDEVDPDRAFRELGIDSLTAVALRNTVTAETGVRLPVTVVFDHPTVTALTDHLLAELGVAAVDIEHDAAAPAATATDDPIVVVGMACRFPGGIRTPDQLWQVLHDGVDVIGGFPTDRGWDLDGLYDPDPDREGRIYTRSGGFLHDAAEFDPEFFGISPREALAMDPQQRLLLESSWEALERAGIDPRAAADARTGVFIGAAYQGFGGTVGSTDAPVGPEGAEGHIVTGLATSVASGRISYSFGFEGPAVTIDTACSSSLVALHQASQSIRDGDCDRALVGGVAVMVAPVGLLGFSRQRGLSEDGRCRAFSADADGMGLAEGAGMLVIERLSVARAAGHPVLAVVRASAINQDGASNGLSAPSGKAQERVIRAALRRAGLTAADVDVVEAHGTGTTLGDPIEAGALLATYGRDRDPERPLWLGSVKSNIGHTQAAAGAAGLMKMVLALQHSELPATLHADNPSPYIDWESGAVRLLTEARPWAADGRPRRAGVSAFGVSGTNVHVILEEPPTREPEPVPVAPIPVPWVVSARTEAALDEMIAGVGGLPADGPRAQAAAAVLARKTAFEHRAVLDAATGAVLARGRVAARGSGTVFVFPGQGAQWAGMGRELLAASDGPGAVFAARFAECADAIAAVSDIDARAAVADTSGAALEDVAILQSVSWALMVALAAMWESVGVRPAAVIGHSQGEIAAAVVAGALSLADGARVVTARALALRGVAGTGAMGSIGEGIDAVRARLAGRDSVVVAVVNGPASVVVAGTPEEVEAVLAEAAADGVRTRLLPVDYASHSPLMQPLAETITGALAGIGGSTPDIPWYSTARPGWVDTALEPVYWFANLSGTVHFSDAVAAVAAAGYDAFVEIGTHPVLVAAVLETADAAGHEVTASGTLRRDEGDLNRVVAALAEAWTAGVAVDWTRVLPGDRSAAATVPTYPFQRKRLWLNAIETAAPDAAAGDAEFWAVVERQDPAELARTLGTDTDAVSGLLPTLAAWRRRHDRDGAVAAWRHRVRWVSATAPGHSRLTGHWLVLTETATDVRADGSATGARADGTAAGARADGTAADACVDGTAADACVDGIAADVRADGIAAGARVDGTAADACVDGIAADVRADGIAAGARADGIAAGARAEEVVAALIAAGAEVTLRRFDPADVRLDDGTDPAGILLLPDAEPVGAVPGGVLTLAMLLRALGTAESTASVWCATRAAVPATDADPVDERAAGVWGLGRIAAQEYPDRWGGLVDLPARLDDRTGGLLAAVLAGAGALAGEDQVAVRPAGLFVRRLEHASRGAARSAWTPRGTVLVTGGTGALAGHVARWLAGAGAQRLVLAGRRGPDAPGAAELRAELIDKGAAVDVVACDVTDRAALAALLDTYRPDAVVHTAGIVDDELIADLDADRAAAVCAPKVLAAQYLDELTRDRELDAFVLFSSMAGALGGSGQGAYAAANATLDALAERRRREGLPATAIGWGAWAGDGLAEAVSDRLRGQGVLPMDPESAVAAMAAAVGSGAAHVIVADVDWARHAEVLTASRPLPALAGIPEAAPAPAAQETDLPILAGLDAEERRAAVRQLVRTEVATALGLDGPADVVSDRTFRDLGFDSLTAVDLRNRLVRATGVRLPVTLVFDYPTVDELADHLLARWSADLGVAVTRTEATADTLAPRPVPTGDDVIAIVGMACRLPGGVTSPQDLWDLLERRGDAVVAFPTDRGWDVAGRYHPDPEHRGTFATTGGGFLDDPAGFDAEFFGISPREALTIDPQHRLLLETSWEAFERAGIAPASLRGSRTGVFVGSNYHDYGSRLSAEPGIYEGQLATGSAGSVASGRVAYSFGLQGPAVTLDTACSSSLVAMHMAAQALRTGECSLALAGGVTVISSLDTFIEFSRQGALSPDGRCRAFAEDADGAGWAEGVGVVVLERLADARAAGHPVLALLRSSAINSDGASNGLTAPNGPAQQRVIRDALAAGDLSPADIDAVEAHGTGTRLGDPIEAQALLNTYGAVERAHPLWLGALKSNIGHTQAAAGIAGVIKSVLALRHGRFPATLHAETPSSRIEWDSGAVQLAQSAVELPETGRPWRIGVSSFGISGTNAHVIVEQAPAEAVAQPGAEPEVVPWQVSARSPETLREVLDAMASRWTPDVPRRAVAAALRHRSVFDHRGVVLAGATAEPSVVGGAVVPGPTGILLSGQGSQRLGMGRLLRESFEPFATAFDAARAAVDAHLTGSVADVIDGDDAELLAGTGRAQPALFAYHVAGYRLLESWGVAPGVLVGHSVGEIAAAHLSGALSLADAARLVAARATAMAALPEGGAMAAISATADRLAALTADLPEGLSVAAHNSATNLVLSGPAEALERVLAERADGLRVSRLVTSHAFHSPLMAPAAAAVERVAAELEWRDPALPVISTHTGVAVDRAAWADPRHWSGQLTAPVRFAAAVAEAMRAHGVGRWIELAPHATLTGHVAADHSAVVTACLGDKNIREPLAAHRAAATLWVAGADLPGWPGDPAAPAAAVLPALPTYPFAHQRYWLDAPVPVTPESLGLAATGQLVLAGHLALAGADEHLFTGRLSVTSHRWLADHAVGGAAIVPATAYLELALDAAARSGAGAVRELTVQVPLVLPEAGGVDVQARVHAAAEDGSRMLTVDAREDGGDWVRHAEGTLGAVDAGIAELPGAWPPAGATPLTVTGLYERMADGGFAYGPAFRGLRAAWRDGDAVLAEVALPEHVAADAARAALHPALLDAALHTIALDRDPGDGAVMPFSVRSVRIDRRGAAALRVRMRATGPNTVALDLADAAGSPIGRVEEVALRPVPRAVLAGSRSRTMYRVDWVPASTPVTAPAAVEFHTDLMGVSGEIGGTVVVPAPIPADGTLPERTAAATRAALLLVQRWLTLPQRADARLVVLTTAACAAGDHAPDPAAAAVLGLVRAAQAEHPDRFVVLDHAPASVPGHEVTEAAVGAAVASGEPVLAWRDGQLRVPRLTPAASPAEADPDWRGTVLVTGGTGGLGAAVARHLAARPEVERLVLTSRRGPAAEGVEDLRAELTGLGAEVEIVAADLTTDDGVAAAIAAADGRVDSVVHAAGVIDDGAIESLTPERIAPVLAPKVDAVTRLAERLPQARLVLFSSLSGTFGGVGQANYSAANAALDALATHWRGGGREVVSIAWGLWAVRSGMTGELSAADRARLARGGVVPMDTAESLALLDAAVAAGTATVVAARFDIPALRAASGGVPALLSAIAPAAPAAGPASAALPATASVTGVLDRLRGASEEERAEILLDLVRTEAALVLGHSSIDAIPVDQGFLDVGFDSLTAVELRNRLGAATGLRLPATMLFDYPNMRRLAGLLDELLPADEHGPGLAEIARLEGIARGLNGDDRARQALVQRLQDVLGVLGAGAEPADPAELIESASDGELFDIIDGLGVD